MDQSDILDEFKVRSAIDEPVILPRIGAGLRRKKFSFNH